jgi:hypothetical protein
MKTSKAEIIREYGPFPEAEKVNGVSFDGKHVWFASGNRLNTFDPESGKKLRSLDVAGHAGTAFDGEHLFQIAENRIQKIDPKTGRVLATIPATGRPETPLAARVASGSGQMQTPSGPFKRTRKGVPLSGNCRRTHEGERGMNVQRRNFLLSATLLAAAATPTLGQVVVPTIRPDSGTQRAVSIPDFSGIWGHPYWPSFEPPASGPGPITNKLRGPNGAGNGVRLVGDTTPLRS